MKKSSISLENTLWQARGLLRILRIGSLIARMSFLTGLIFFIILLFFCLSLFSEEYPRIAKVDELEKTLSLYVGETVFLPVQEPQRIVIGKPEVVDVLKATETKIILVAKRKGETTFVWWDKFGEHSLSIKVYLEDVIKLKKRIDELIRKIGLKGVYTKAAQEEEKVLLLGEVKKKEDKERFFTALGELKDKTLDFINVREDESSVEISVQVLELDKDAVRTLGFDLPSALTLTESSGPTSASVTGFSNIFRVSDWMRSAFTTTLDLLIKSGKARILSRPRLVCRSGKEAELLVGGEVPVFTTEVAEAGGEGTNVEYKEYGIKLNMVPTVISEDKLDLVLNIEVSEVGEAEVIGSPSAPTAKAYPLTKRRISTELSLKNQETVSIGGLIKKKTEEDLKKFPWLADIPVLGAFFRHKDVKIGGGSGKRGDTELFVTLTPKIFFSKKSKPLAEDKEVSFKRELSDYYKNLNIPDELKEYVSDVKKRILQNISYPPFLRGTGWEADVLLSLKISSDGELKNVQIIKSSGYKIFDEATLKTVKSLSFSPFPPQISLEEIEIKVPVVYRAER